MLESNTKKKGKFIMSKNEFKKAVIYARVSSKEQEKEGE